MVQVLFLASAEGRNSFRKKDFPKAELPCGSLEYGGTPKRKKGIGGRSSSLPPAQKYHPRLYMRLDQAHSRDHSGKEEPLFVDCFVSIDLTKTLIDIIR